MPTGKPDSERDQRAPGEVAAALHESHADSPASGPNSGPTTIAPTMRIGWSSRIPTAAISIASTMKATKLNYSSVLLGPALSTSSQTTASAGKAGRGLLGLATRRPRARCRRCSTAIEPVTGISSSFRSLMITLASSRATSQRITSPVGLRAAPRGGPRSHRRRGAQEPERVLASRRGDDPQVDHQAASAAAIRPSPRRTHRESASSRLQVAGHEHVTELALGQRAPSGAR